MDKKSLAALVRTLRKRQHLNRAQFASLVFMSPSSVERLEIGERNLLFEEAVRITKVLNVTLDDLAGLK